MIGLPRKGIAVSVTAHNVDRHIFCDWIEASATFLGLEIAGSDIVDLLIENNIYKDQDFAWHLVEDAMRTLGLRSRLLGDGYPLVATEGGYEARGEWEDYAPYAFCLMLSLARSHSNWIRDTFGPNYNEQGELFELLTAEAVSLSLSGWRVHPTGWTRTRTNLLKQVVSDICAQVNEAAGDVASWTKDTAKEAGLDLVSWRPFADGNVGVPVYLWQCASGMDWERKRKTPDLAIWNKVITWAVRPKRAMAMPFALSDNDMRQHSNVVEGLLLDRHRLLEPGINSRDWISEGLKSRLIDWLWPRVAQLPMLGEQI